MLKVMKWEFIKRVHQFKILYATLFAFLIISFFTPPHLNSKNSLDMIAASSSAFGGTAFLVLSIYLIIAITADIKAPTGVLEKCISKKPWEILSAKLANNLICMLILYGTIRLLEMILKKFSTYTTSYLQINLPFTAVIIAGFFLPLFILFFFLLAKSLTMTKNNPVMATVVLLVATSILISNILDRILISDILLNLITLGLSIGLFFGCCYFYEHHYEISQ